jgi:hypothetical protein
MSKLSPDSWPTPPRWGHWLTRLKRKPAPPASLARPGEQKFRAFTDLDPATAARAAAQQEPATKPAATRRQDGALTTGGVLVGPDGVPRK